MSSSKQSYAAPAITEIGTVADVTRSSLNKQVADRNIQAGEQNTSS